MVGIVLVGSVQSANIEKMVDKCMNSFLKIFTLGVGLAKTVFIYFYYHVQKRETNSLLLLWLTPLR